MKLWTLIAIASVCWACDARTSQDDYDDFRTRTADYRKAPCEQNLTTEVDPDTDLSGVWLIRSRLGAGLALGLRISFERRSNESPREYEVKFWLHDQAEDAPPLVVTETIVDDAGQFQMIADPLDLGKDVVQSESAVLARVILDAGILSSDAWCGGVSGQVTSPLNLDLDGSTFYAQRKTEGLSYEDLPSGCPSTSCDEDADSGVATDMGTLDATVVRPESPNLDAFSSERTELTGDWLMKASLGGLPMSLWITFYDRSADGTGGLDGAVRLNMDVVDSPPRTTFFTTVDADGRFEIWLPDLYLEIATLVIEANLLLSAISQDAYWCGAGAGAVSQPFEIDLDGATFYAVPWVPGSEEPADQLNACPSE